MLDSAVLCRSRFGFVKSAGSETHISKASTADIVSFQHLALDNAISVKRHWELSTRDPCVCSRTFHSVVSGLTAAKLPFAASTLRILLRATEVLVLPVDIPRGQVPPGPLVYSFEIIATPVSPSFRRYLFLSDQQGALVADPGLGGRTHQIAYIYQSGVYLGPLRGLAIPIRSPLSLSLILLRRCSSRRRRCRFWLLVRRSFYKGLGRSASPCSCHSAIINCTDR